MLWLIKLWLKSPYQGISGIICWQFIIVFSLHRKNSWQSACNPSVWVHSLLWLWFRIYLSTFKITITQNIMTKLVSFWTALAVSLLVRVWLLYRGTVPADFVKGGKQTQSALRCELWSQASVEETLWSRKMMCFPAKWLPVSGRTPECLLLLNRTGIQNGDALGVRPGTTES